MRCDAEKTYMLMLCCCWILPRHEGVIQIESIFGDTPGGLLPNKERALQHAYPVIVMEHLSGGDLLHRIDARARAGE